MRLRAISMLCMMHWQITYAAYNNQIPDVVIKPIKNTGSSSSTTITRDQLTSSNTSSLAQALQNLGGIQLRDMSGNGSQVMMSMRGFGGNASSNTLLLINGIPITSPDLAPPDLNIIPVQDIQQIEIFAGSESILYGDQAVGGAINITTRETPDSAVELSCDAGSYSAKHCYAGFSNAYRKLTYRLTVDTTHTDNYRQHNDYKQNQWSGHLSYPYQSGEWAFNVRAVNETMQYPGALTARQVREDRQQASNDTDFFKDQNHFLHLRHKQWLPNEWILETDFAQRGVNGDGNLFSPFTQSRSIYFIKPQLKGSISKTNIRSGVELEQDNYQLASTFGKTTDDLQKYSLYTTADYQLQPSLSLNAGIRGAIQNNRLASGGTQSAINRALALTLGLTYDYSDGSSVYLRRAGSYRFPKADENSASTSGTSSLRTQRGTSYETGIEIKRNVYSAKFNLFQLNLRDEIAFDPQQTAQNPFGTNRNLPPTIRRGISISGKRSINSVITANSQLNLIDAHFQQGNYSGNRIPLVSEALLRTGLQYQISEHWDAYAEAVFTGNQYAANDDENIDGINGGYTIFNASAHYRLKNFDISLRVNNIFNKAYYYYTIYQSNPAGEYFYPAAERNISLLVKCRFG